MELNRGLHNYENYSSQPYFDLLKINYLRTLLRVRPNAI